MVNVGELQREPTSKGNYLFSKTIAMMAMGQFAKMLKYPFKVCLRPQTHDITDMRVASKAYLLTQSTSQVFENTGNQGNKVGMSDMDKKIYHDNFWNLS